MFANVGLYLWLTIIKRPSSSSSSSDTPHWVVYTHATTCPLSCFMTTESEVTCTTTKHYMPNPKRSICHSLILPINSYRESNVCTMLAQHFPQVQLGSWGLSHWFYLFRLCPRNIRSGWVPLNCFVPTRVTQCCYELPKYFPGLALL